MKEAIVTAALFDGERHRDGPFTVTVADGRIAAVEPGAHSELPVRRVAYLMPGLVEAHAHLFLDGAELDQAARSAHLKAPLDAMLAVGRANLRDSLGIGITLIRDAGDRFGVNQAMRAEATAAALPLVRSAALGLRRPKQYGAFMAREVGPDADPAAMVRELAAEADDIKIILTGIIDFEAGEVTTPPQFDAETLKAIVDAAHAAGKRTFAHCSGAAGLKLAVAAGVDSIEHGFFMSRDILGRMAERGIAWVPTFAPVAAQRGNFPVEKILDDHARHLVMAAELGVPLAVGSDAGSQGVPHGTGLLDEMAHMRAAGLDAEAVLTAATTAPRRLWGADDTAIRPGNLADLIALPGSPLTDFAAFRSARCLYRAGRAA